MVGGEHLSLIKRFNALSRKHALLWWSSLGLMVISLLLTLPLPWVSMKLIDKAISESDAQMFSVLLIAWSTVILLRLGVGFAQGYFLMRFQLAFGQDIRNRLAFHLFHSPLIYFADKQTGYLTTRLFQDVEDSISIVGARLIDLVRSTLNLVFGIAFVFLINWKLAALSLAIVPFYFINQILFNKKIRAREREKREAWAKVAGFLQERLSGLYSVKSNNAEGNEARGFNEMSSIGIARSLKSWFTIQWSRGILNAVRELGPVIILAYAGLQVLESSMTVGELFGFVGYMGMLFGPASTVLDFFITMQVAVVALERVFEILDSPEEEGQTGPTALPREQLLDFKGGIEFRDVHFSYETGKPPALEGCTLKIDPGQSIALVGKTGAGKTSIANLIMRFYSPQAGQVLIDGNDVSRIPLKILRQIVYVVPQEPFLFTGTIEQNIVYGKLDATHEEVATAAKMAMADRFISRLPGRYQAVIGEKGVQLSGGQKQMISIARAFLRNPKIILLDEATSAVDSESESEIRHALADLMAGRTSVVISHRLSSLLGVERLVVLEGGKVVEDGTREQLALTGGTYARLFSEQMVESLKQD